MGLELTTGGLWVASDLEYDLWVEVGFDKGNSGKHIVFDFIQVKVNK